MKKIKKLKKVKKVVKPTTKKKVKIKTILKKNPIKKPKVSVPEKEVTISEEVAPVKKRKKRKASVSKMYFTDDTEKYIILYNEEEDQNIRNNIYEMHIKNAFDKLVENIFNTFKFTYFDNSPSEIKKETVAHLVANMHKFEKGKGKAFSYFSIVAKNYLIFHNNGNYKKFNQHVNISDTPDESAVCLQVEDAYHKNTEMSEFMALMIDYWEKNIHKIFTKERDLGIANAVIELFRNGGRIDSFNKKSLYLYIREISSCKTQQITKVINKMKHYQNIITKAYLNKGSLQSNLY
jgi:hypothetical protein